MADILGIIREIEVAVALDEFDTIRITLDELLPTPSAVDVASIRYYLTKYLKGATFRYGDTIGWFYVEDEA